jgi:hypothetical protein
MNSSTLARPRNNAWLQRGAAIVGTVLVGGAIVAGVALQPFGALTPAASSVASPSAGRERFAELKQAQVDARDAAFTVAPAYDAGRERLAALKKTEEVAREADLVTESRSRGARER